MLSFLSFCVVLTISHAQDYLTKGDEFHMRIQNKIWANSKKRIKLLPYNVTADKTTVCIMTRDNICLSSNVFYPNELIHGKGPYSVLYANTPYGKSSLDSDADVANEQGWVYIGQDMRGRGKSNGSYAFWRTQGNDSLDTIQWTINQKWSNGQVAVIGVSANCLSQYADITGVTQYAQNSANWDKYMDIFLHMRFGQLFLGNGMGYQTVYPGGAYRNGLISGWLGPYINEYSTIPIVQANEAFTPEYWQGLAGPWHDQWHWPNMSAIHFAGWYDIFGQYQIETAMYLNSSGLDYAKGNQILIIDPGGHCVIGEIPWVEDTRGFEMVEYYGLPATNAAYQHGLSNNISQFSVHDYFPFNVYFYMLGPSIEECNATIYTSTGLCLDWIGAKGFPKYKQEKWYLSDRHLLTRNTSDVVVTGSQSYVYDPMNPVPTHGGNNFLLKPCGPQNQNKVEKGREDVIQFSSEKLTGIIPIIGPLSVNLFVGSSAVDTDFTVNVVDVFPDGRRMLVQNSIFRMRWRNGVHPPPYAASPAPHMTPDEVYNITLDIGHMSYIFFPGHRIGLGVSSSNYPRYSINYNSGLMVIDNSTDWQNATNTIYWGMGKHPASVSLPVVDVNWIINNKMDWEAFDKEKEEKEKEYQENVQKIYNKIYNNDL
eukprot:434085_1